MRDATGENMSSCNDDEMGRDDHEGFGTVEVQILLSWFFDEYEPGGAAGEVPRAA